MSSSKHLSSVTSVGFCFLGYAIAYTLFTILAGVLTDSKIKVNILTLRMMVIIMIMFILKLMMEVWLKV